MKFINYPILPEFGEFAEQHGHKSRRTKSLFAHVHLKGFTHPFKMVIHFEESIHINTGRKNIFIREELRSRTGGNIAPHDYQMWSWKTIKPEYLISLQYIEL